MAGHCNHGLYFHSPSDPENMTHTLVQYPAILHSKPLNNIYLLVCLSNTEIQLSTYTCDMNDYRLISGSVPLALHGTGLYFYCYNYYI